MGNWQNGFRGELDICAASVEHAARVVAHAVGGEAKRVAKRNGKPEAWRIVDRMGRAWRAEGKTLFSGSLRPAHVEIVSPVLEYGDAAWFLDVFLLLARDEWGQTKTNVDQALGLSAFFRQVLNGLRAEDRETSVSIQGGTPEKPKPFLLPAICAVRFAAVRKRRPRRESGSRRLKVAAPPA